MSKMIISLLVSFSLVSSPLSARQKDSFSLRALRKTAKKVLREKGIYPSVHFEKPDWMGDIPATEWVKMISLIAGGIFLLTYPPPISNLGMVMIKVGIGYIGWEYYEAIMSYLIDHDIIDTRLPQDDFHH